MRTSGFSLIGTIHRVGGLIFQEGTPMFDKFGRLLCPTCGEPMTRAAKFDSQHEGVVRTAFTCDSCEAMMMLTGRTSPAEAENQRAP